MYAKYLNESKHQFLIKGCENVKIKHLNDPKAFMQYSQCMDDVHNNIDGDNPKRERRILIAFDDMTADIMPNKKFQAMIKELFIICRKLSIPLVFITQSYFSVPKCARSNSMHYGIMKIYNKKSYKILLLIIQQILIIKILQRFTGNAQVNHFLF